MVRPGAGLRDGDRVGRVMAQTRRASRASRVGAAGMLQRLTASEAEIEAQELRAESAESGCTPGR